MSSIELTSEEFTPKLLLSIFEAVVTDEVGRKFNPEHFFPTWQQWMRLGVAKAWFRTGVVLGAVFSQCVFTGERQAQCVFWFALPKVRGTEVTKQVFQDFEEYAKSSGANLIFSSAYDGLDRRVRAMGYEKHGFNHIESIFRKRLS